MSQMMSIKTGGNVWREIDDYYGGFTEHERELLESDTYCVNMESNGCWLYISSRFSPFRSYFNAAKTASAAMTDATTKSHSRALLQSIYDRIPFIEMKRSGYDFYVEAPN